MSQTVADPLEDVIRKSGQDWLIDWYAPREQALPNLRRILATVYERARARLGYNAPHLTPDGLANEYARNPHKVTAFLQIIGAVATPDILLMVWRILQGMNIAEIRMNYLDQQEFTLYVRLSSPYESGDDEVYESHDIDDAVVLRHLGTMKIGDAPIFDGFYGLRLKSNAK
jgi:hypothetical protein